MYKLKHVSQLGNDVTYDIEYKSFLGTKDISIYHDNVLNIWDGTIIEYGTWRDLTPDEITTIMKGIE